MSRLLHSARMMIFFLVLSVANSTTSNAVAQALCPDGQRSYFGFCPAQGAAGLASGERPANGQPRYVTAPVNPAFEQGYALFRQGRHKEAASQFQLGANQSDARSQFALGLLYWRESSRPPYSSQAQVTGYGWIKKAADQGYVPAWLVVGGLYDTFGIKTLLGYQAMKAPPPIPPGDYSGESWLRKAAEAGYRPAMLMMGCRNYEGPEKRKIAKANGYREQVYWFSRLADAGDMVGEFNMGVLYDVGRGVSQDTARAREYYNRAAAHGLDLGPVQNLKALADKSAMTPFVDTLCGSVTDYMNDLSGTREVLLPGLKEVWLTYKVAE
jgi:TPR repeat protein